MRDNLECVTATQAKLSSKSQNAVANMVFLAKTIGLLLGWIMSRTTMAVTADSAANMTTSMDWSHANKEWHHSNENHWHLRHHDNCDLHGSILDRFNKSMSQPCPNGKPDLTTTNKTAPILCVGRSRTLIHDQVLKWFCSDIDFVQATPSFQTVLS